MNERTPDGRHSRDHDLFPASTDGQAQGPPHRQRLDSEDSTSAGQAPPINVLIVDDESRNLLVLETILSGHGYRLVRAESANQALLALVVEEFALIILDIRMPGMTGLELAQMIKGRKKTALVPIIFLTAYYLEDQHILDGYGTGAVDYLQKPVNPMILRSKVAVFAELHRKSRELEIANRALLAEVIERRRAEEELDAQRQQLKGIITSAMDAIITVDEEHRVVIFNCAAESMFGYQAADVIGQPLDRFMPERYRQAHHHHMRAFGQTADPSRSMDRGSQLFGQRADGAEFPIEASISHIRVVGRTLFTVILRDITERKKAEEAVRASEAFTQSVMDSLSAYICVLDREGVILQTNETWREFGRMNADDTVVGTDCGCNYLEVCRQAMARGVSAVQSILEGIEAVQEGRLSTFSLEYPCHSPHEERWFLTRITPMKSGQGIVMSHTDISRLVRMGLELEQHVLLLGDKQQELEVLTGRLIEVQEQERKRIARDLHDDFNQRLAVLSVELAIVQRALVAAPEPIPRQLTAVRGQIVQLSNDLHDLAYKLHPSLLEHVGLEIALRDHIAQFTKQTGLPVTCLVRAVPGTLPPEIATALFRVIQESLQNVCKHAQATAVTVRLSGSSKGIGVSVRDNGKGFEMDRPSTQRPGIGLISMHERARLQGGYCKIRSCSTQGTTVCAWIPLSPEAI